MGNTRTALLTSQSFFPAASDQFTRRGTPLGFRLGTFGVDVGTAWDVALSISTESTLSLSDTSSAAMLGSVGVEDGASMGTIFRLEGLRG